MELGTSSKEALAQRRAAPQPPQAQAGRQGVDERAEADALHHPLDPDCRPDRVHVTSLGPGRLRLLAGYLPETYETNY